MPKTPERRTASWAALQASDRPGTQSVVVPRHLQQAWYKPYRDTAYRHAAAPRSARYTITKGNYSLQGLHT